jgi:hypothetical protein
MPPLDDQQEPQPSNEPLPHLPAKQQSALNRVARPARSQRVRKFALKSIVILGFARGRLRAASSASKIERAELCRAAR